MAETGSLARATIASPPNEKALEERQKDRPCSDPGKSQEHRREARSGGMDETLTPPRRREGETCRWVGA